MNIHKDCSNSVERISFSNIADFTGDFLDLQDFLEGLPSSHSQWDTPEQNEYFSIFFLNSYYSQGPFKM